LLLVTCSPLLLVTCSPLLLVTCSTLLLVTPLYPVTGHLLYLFVCQMMFPTAGLQLYPAAGHLL
jgi:hypothetical protein